MTLPVSHLPDDEGEWRPAAPADIDPRRGTHHGLGAAVTDLNET